MVFGPTPHGHAFKLPKKVRANALRSALTRRVSQSHFLVLDGIDLPEIKTRRVVEIMRRFGIESALLVLPERDDVVERSARNIPHVSVLPTMGLNVYDILKHRTLILTVSSVRSICERLSS